MTKICQKLICIYQDCRNKLQLHDAIYLLRFYSNLLIRILSLSNSHNNVESILKNRGDKLHRVIVAIKGLCLQLKRSETKFAAQKTNFLTSAVANGRPLPL